MTDTEITAAEKRVADAWEANVDPRDELGWATLGGPVVKVHQVEGFPDIVEYVRDESHMTRNGFRVSFHGETQFGIAARNKVSFRSLQEALLHAMAEVNGVDLNEARFVLPHAWAMLGGEPANQEL